MDLDFVIEPNAAPTSAEERVALMSEPGFAKHLTDHMLTIRYDRGQGWHDARIGARAPFSLDPACAVLHYGQEIFEGLKAYRTAEGGAALFRPDANAARFNRSADRMAMPELPEAVFQDAVARFVAIERDWIPDADGSALYLRPFMFATEAFLGVRPAHSFMFAIIGAPAGAYFSKGAGGISVWISEEFTRAAPGGTGAAKCGGNYAASLATQAEAIESGCDQVLFLDAAERRWVEELGGMNVVFVMADGSLITPPLGTILPGVTRDSLMTLARDRGRTVREEPYSIEMLEADARSGKLVECFACGTAAVVSPIAEFRARNRRIAIGDGTPGPVSGELRAALLDIQNGRAPDPHGWVVPVPLD